MNSTTNWNVEVRYHRGTIMQGRYLLNTRGEATLRTIYSPPRITTAPR